ncbi:oxygenase MpaB family protein [Dermatobacter hominis]|uniref:oxygenase MpaB family protein n=1 Tax=Dermatobacter hominis TaxID=2884263 RepID=UPI001D1224B6|nr:oxygenase MpaB family protein [Dermatobacter hominis]UDY34295.1 oxygenase MpaB family protein [Dermatobacter hominis]
MDPIESFRRRVVADIEAVGGRHDEAELYEGEPGDPGLVGGPDSISWELHGDLAIVSAAGSAAIIMEVLHPSVMAGVSQQSTFRTEPIKRAQNTLGYVLRTTFGSTPAATEVIGKVRHVHSFVEGTRPDGQPYRALDPELLAWVHTCIPWAIMTAYDRYRRPLSSEEKDRYLGEQAVVGRMGGGEGVPTSVDELDAFVERIRPELAVNEQTREFIRFLAEGAVEGQAVGPRERAERWMGLRGSMMLMPRWARELTGLDHGNVAARALSDRLERTKVAVVRWAVPELPCAAIARRRATGAPDPVGVTGSAA